MRIGQKLGVGFGSLMVMTVALATVLLFQEKGVERHVYEVLRTRVPVVELCEKLESQVNRALSAQRAHMIFRLDSLAQDRMKAWQAIDGYMGELEGYSASWDAPTRSDWSELRGVMEELRVAQQRVEDVRWTPEDYPSRTRYYANVVPIGEQMLSHIDAVLAAEMAIEGGEGRKQLVRWITEAKTHLLRVRDAMSTYMASGTPEALDELERRLAGCEASVARLRAMSGAFTGEQARHFETYLETRGRFLGGLIEAAEDRAKAGYCVSETICLDVITPLAARGQDLMSSISATQAAARDEAAERAEGALSSMVKVGGLTALAVVVAGAAIAFFLTRQITGGLRRVLAFVERLAERDLREASVEVASKDEIGVLARAATKMAVSLREVISEVSASSDDVAAAAAEIASSSEEMSRSVREQSREVEQVSGAVSEMSASITEVAGRSESAVSSAQQSGDAAEVGGETVERTIEAMNSINCAVRDGAASVQELGKRGEQIGTIIDTINEIAEQTNLLALNAAIEAARAGEHGRGFAVVADEVRRLAERTTHATQEVTASVRAIQEETTQAVERMSLGTGNVAEGVRLASEAGESLRGIVRSASSVREVIQAIAAAAEQQSVAANEIARRIETVNASSGQTAQGTEQAVAAASQLASRAEQLRGLVGRFSL